MEAVVVLLLEPDPWRYLGFVHVLVNRAEIKLIEGVDYHRITTLKGPHPHVNPSVVMVAHTLVTDFNLSLLSKIKELFPRAHVLVHGYETNLDKVAEILIAGAKGYFILSSQPESLLESLQFVSKGLIWGPPEAIARSLGRLINLKDTKPVAARTDLMTPRERTLVNFLANGLSNKQIANKLGVAEVTVKFHFAKLYKRFKVQTRLQLLTVALDQGLVGRRGLSETRVW